MTTIRVPRPEPGTVLVVMADGERWVSMPVAREFFADAAMPVGEFILEQLDDGMARAREQDDGL